MLTLHLQAADSRYADEDELHAAGIDPEHVDEQLPSGYRLMAHQAATIRALRSGNVPIIINEAMTGDGKTLAGQFMLFNEGWDTFTMYPTNELARDQQRGLQALLENWTPVAWGKRNLAQILNAATIDARQLEADELTRMEIIQGMLKRPLTLTNPDIFHLIMQFAYHDYGKSHDILPAHLAHKFWLYVFDEFHLFGAAQTISVMIAVLLLRALVGEYRQPRFLFLSATPQHLLGHLAQMAGITVERIGGDYLEGSVDTPPNYRRILQPVTLSLYPERMDAWVEAHFEDVIARFYKENKPGAKGVIIVNSVATAHRLRTLLGERCQQAGITLGMNTGLTPLTERQLGSVDLLIATSTVDVGVDFRINLLIFESADAASHLQRLGRLGRHLDDGLGNTFHQFEAHALLPEWVITELERQFKENNVISRADYQTALGYAYPSLQQFPYYAKHWGGIQARHVTVQLSKVEIKTQYESIAQPLRETYKTLFPGGFNRYSRLLNEQQDAILDAARSFRGGSPFTALVINHLNDSSEVMSYNLLPLLRYAELEPLDLENLIRRAESQGQANARHLKQSKALAAYTIYGWLLKPRPLGIERIGDIGEEQFETVTQLYGFRLDVPDVPELWRLNQQLQTRMLATLLLPNDDPDTLRRKLKLGFQLELLRFQGRDGRGTAVFGRDALLLDSARYHTRRTSGDAPIFS